MLLYYNKYFSFSFSFDRSSESLHIAVSSYAQINVSLISMIYLLFVYIFSDVIHSFTKIASELNQMVVRMLFESYGIKKDEPLVNSTNYLLRLLKYGRSQGETNVGFKAHMDKTFLTLLYQNPVKGLEIRTKEGEWITYEPSSTTSFAVIAGDVCMVGLCYFLFYKIPISNDTLTHT